MHLDRPTGLDPRVGKILNLIKAHHEGLAAVIIVSHSMEDIARPNKILIMNKSKLFCYGDTAEVFKGLMRYQWINSTTVTKL